MAVVNGVHADTPSEAERQRGQIKSWTAWYVRCALGIDFLSVFAAGVVAFGVRFPAGANAYSKPYLGLTVSLPFLWLLVLAVFRAYEPRLIGVGSEEFRRVLQAGFTVTTGVAFTA